MSKVSPIPIENLSFAAYRLPMSEGEYGAPAAFISLAQWFEAEKFRPFHRELFDQVMLAPTIMEARRFAKQHQPYWRGDWLGVRNRAMACGMVYAARADAHQERWRGTAEQIAAELAPLGPLPPRFLLSAAQAFIQLRDAPRIALLGAQAAPPEIVGKRINLVHKRHESFWNLSYWQGRHSCWRVHDWAVKAHVPVEYLGSDGDRLNAKSIEALKTDVSQVVVFEQRKGKAMDNVLRGLRAAKIPVDLDFFTVDENAKLT